ELVGGRFFGGNRVFVFDKVGQNRFFLVVADACVQAGYILLDLHDVLDFVDFYLHGGGDFFVGRFAVKLLCQTALGAQQLVDSLYHVHRDTDGASLVGDGAGDGLADPPGSVGTELKAFVRVELFDGAQQAGIALLDKVQKIQAAADVTLSDADNEAHVGLGHLVFG